MLCDLEKALEQLLFHFAFRVERKPSSVEGAVRPVTLSATVSLEEKKKGKLTALD